MSWLHSWNGSLRRRAAAQRPGGAVAQVEVTGLIATAFDHFDSRAGDPQLHTHVVVSNKVRSVFDGKWRSLECGRAKPLPGALSSCCARRTCRAI